MDLMTGVFNNNMSWKTFRLIFQANFGCSKIIVKKLFSKILMLPFDFQASTWWSVNLIALYKILLVRIVTALGNKPQNFKGLEILIGKLTRISSAI